MNRALIKKCIADALWLFVSLAALLVAFCWFRVWIISFLEMPSFAAVVQPLWDKFGQFSPVALEHLLSYPGRVALTFVEPLVFLSIVIWGIARGSDAVSGELSRGTMEIVMAQPVGRLQVLCTQAGITMIGLALLCFCCWFGVFLGIEATQIVEPPTRPTWTIPGTDWTLSLPFGRAEPRVVGLSTKVSVRDMIPPTLNLFCLGFAVAGLATAMSSWDRYRWRSIGIVSGIFILQMMIKIGAKSAESLAFLERFTFLSAFEPQVQVQVAVDYPAQLWSWRMAGVAGAADGWGPLGSDMILLAIGLVSYLAAIVVFCRRDLPAPI
ncbi:MAG: hypothetical protein CMJ59_13850 [Planctomycetaceae bacterium]|nr:hypothetical protein [Planctomycetaceae bacterium]